MIQILIIGVGFIGIAHMMSTPEQRTAARTNVKQIEPYAWTVIIGGVGFVIFAWMRG